MLKVAIPRRGMVPLGLAKDREARWEKAFFLPEGKMKARGRPTKLTSEVIQRIAEHVEKFGMSMFTEACTLAGVHPDTARDWRKRGIGEDGKPLTNRNIYAIFVREIGKAEATHNALLKVKHKQAAFGGIIVREKHVRIVTPVKGFEQSKVTEISEVAKTAPDPRALEKELEWEDPKRFGPPSVRVDHELGKTFTSFAERFRQFPDVPDPRALPAGKVIDITLEQEEGKENA